MHLHNPSMILVPDTFLSVNDVSLASSSAQKSQTTSMLVQCMTEEFEGVPIEPVMRKYWNENAGLEFVNQLTVDDDERAATLVAVSNKSIYAPIFLPTKADILLDRYYALSAASALFKHSELRLNTRFSASSLLIRYLQVEGTMLVDSDSARNLELVGNMSMRRSAHSLFGLLNHAFTPMGARLLRVNILAPITGLALNRLGRPHLLTLALVKPALEARLDAVEELVQSEDRFGEVKNAFKPLNKLDLDKLIASLASSEVRETNSAKTASARVSQMLNLRNIVQSLPRLVKALQGSRSQLLQIIAEGGLNGVNARVYAVRANFNRLLDVARETYKENVGDIYGLRNRLAEEFDLPLSLVYRDSDAGFVFALKKSDLEDAGGELPRGFIDITAQKGRLVFSSIELKRNARMKDALDESLILSNKIIADLTDEIVVDIGALYKASEAVALLDVLWSFAHVSIIRNYVRPEFTGTLAIKAGRHPVLETIQAAGAMVPNDVYCCEASSFQIVQGPNMSGKSTYLKQIALLTVMAMCGCFVPAEYGSFRIHDALLTRLSNDDDLEKNLSTFANEMASTAMILGLATADSLVLIDEVGRGTSVREGVAISHAIAEELIRLKSYVFFATHFGELTTTLSRQPSVINLHLSVQKSRATASKFGLTFHYKFVSLLHNLPVSHMSTESSTVLQKVLTTTVETICSPSGHLANAIPHSGYSGLDLARLADLPASVISEARRVADFLTEQEEQDQRQSRTSKLAIRRKALLRLRTQLGQALDHSTLPDEELAAYLARFQKDILTVIQETM
ncbi:hypothetical protein BN946_scf184920.g20 [Trametes cinnabarina]|uniref:DNA mismatch repair proteins mutS family domain-containing protein n=1 Tax=Pycnoporus cinnabarinus TaxID=5643 RepID=A0A060SBX8_PYCCI|nr:hypothetical protein BN946_scf184920.g20 [Trametes cinnabarina]